MMNIFRKSIFRALVLLIIFINTGFGSEKNTISILLINSYNQGFPWTDSLTSGIVQTMKIHPEINLYIENMNSKQFGKSNFEIEKKYIQNKYSKITIGGLLVTDNDALDFVCHFHNELFPNVPLAFCGISNPEDYPLKELNYFGFEENGSSDSIVDFIRMMLPEAKKVLVLSDKSTTGLIYRKIISKQVSEIDHFDVVYPDYIDVDSIFNMVSNRTDIDAIYYNGISFDKGSRQIDQRLFIKQIVDRSHAPVFANDPVYVGTGVVGGIFQNGTTQGKKCANLLLTLLESKNPDTIRQINTMNLEYFFDASILPEFNLSMNNFPKKSVVFNENHDFYNRNFSILIYILILLVVIVIVLSVVNRQRRIKQRKSSEQINKIELQNAQMEEAYNQLGSAISELEETNIRLKEMNVNLDAAKKKAEESDNLKSAFLANVSHEIRTPLNSIVGFSSLLSDPDLEETTRNTYIDLIESNTESLLVLIDEIIDLSKIEAEQLTLNKQDFSMDQLLKEQCQIFNQNNRNPDVIFKVVKPFNDKLLVIHSDRVRVKQIFINLLSNALKFTNSGLIELGYLSGENQEIIFYVKDTGIGISKEFHQAIFHRFRKLNENSGKVFRGTGLGLAITQKLVGLLGGKIWLESEPGQGTTFYFTLQNCELKDLQD